MHEDTVPFRSVVKSTLIASGLLIILGYVIFQARFLIMGPQITLTSSPTIIHNDRQIYLTGSTFNISRLWLNDRQIYTDAHGHFKEALILENGYTVATLRAEDRYGRVTTVERPFVYTPSSFIQSI
ncbi:hypothetical protein KC902_02355 [Candidatus Kaiserbacteria bacterium]|nr:hypothetical protein [Candidatus Kaiserbacteria bacterium]USN89030.1 MAG: hypothetical protein H6780_01240 [Candidatus Nomurabacteria bacterium]